MPGGIDDTPTKTGNRWVILLRDSSAGDYEPIGLLDDEVGPRESIEKATQGVLVSGDEVFGYIAAKHCQAGVPVLGSVTANPHRFLRLATGYARPSCSSPNELSHAAQASMIWPPCTLGSPRLFERLPMDRPGFSKGSLTREDGVNMG